MLSTFSLKGECDTADGDRNFNLVAIEEVDTVENVELRLS